MTERLLRFTLWTLAALAALTFVGIGLMRLRYPLEIDFVEGVMMDHVVRLVQGRPIYIAPSLEFVPLAYMPAFTALTAVLAHFFGPAFWEGRLISLVSSLGTAALCFTIVRAETRSSTFAAASAGLFLMGFGAAAGGHYDVVRPDPLMWFLSLSGLALLRFGQGKASAIVSGLLLGVAFLVKQHALLFGVGALVHMAWNDRRRFVPYAASLALVAGGGYGLLTLWLGPWFPFYTWEVPSHWSELSPVRILRYLGPGLMGMLGGLVVPAAISLALPERPWRGRSGVWMWMALAGIGTGLLATLDPTAWKHTFIPTLLAMVVIGPISIHRIMSLFTDGASPARAHSRAVAFAMLSFQFVPLIYSVRSQMPHRHAEEARRELDARIRSAKGTVMVPYHGFYAWVAGRGTSAHILALGDVLRAHHNSLVKRDPGYFDRMFEPLTSGALGATIITDTLLTGSGSPWEDLDRRYRISSEMDDVSLALRPVTGYQVSPRYVYVPREVERAAAGADSGAASPAPAKRASSAAVTRGLVLAHDEPAAGTR